MKRLLIFVATILAVAAVALAVIVWLLQPPYLPVPPREDRLIADVTVINPGAQPAPHQTIVIRDGRITEIRDARGEDGEPLCSGCFAMPGLIDAHVHTPPRVAVGNQQLFALMYLAYGVTSVRDVGQADDSVSALARRLNEGRLVGPHMYRCGPVLEGEPPAWPFATIVRNREEGAVAVNRLADEGVDCIKVYNEVSLDAYDGIESAARARQLPLIGHTPHKVGLARLRDFESQHLTGVPYVTHPRPPPGWDIRNEDVLAMNDADIDAALDIAVANHISFTPTLANFRLRLVASDPQRFPPSEGARHLPALWSDAWDIIAGHPTTPEQIRLQGAARAPMAEITRRAHARGIDILAGTDTLMPWVVPGEALHIEIETLAEALGDSEAALTAATATNGRHIDNGAIGVLAPGARADMLIYASDPRAELHTLRDWRHLFVDGRHYRRETIDAWLAAYDRHFHGAFYATIVGGITALAVPQFRHTRDHHEE